MRWRCRQGRHRWEPWKELEGWRLYAGFWILFFGLVGWSVFCQLVFG